MKYIPLLLSVIFLTGCAGTPTVELHKAAMGCRGELVIEPNGIVRDPTAQEKSEQCKPFWDAYNKRLDALAKREAELEAAEAGRCPRGTTKWCKSRGPGPQRCSCVRNEDARRALDELLGRQY